MIFPNPLTYGDTVGLVSPSSPTTPERVELCKAFVEHLGFRVVVGKSCRKTYHGYLAGSDLERADDINEMFQNPEVKGIFCIRGGYGSARIMELLDYNMIRKNPKIFVGYSDITNLNMAFLKLCNFTTFHGPMVSSNMLEHFDDYTRESFFAALYMNEKYEFHNPVGEELHIISHGRAKGRIVGGNLALLINMIGTFYMPDLSETILFIEDVGESVPRVNRMIDQLYLLGVFEKVRGILIGDFTECENGEVKEFTILDLFTEYFTKLHIPVISNIKSGHGYPMATLPLGTVCNIDTMEKSILFSR